MEHKSIILIVIFTFVLTSVFGQTEVMVEFRKGEKVTKTTNFKFSILIEKDTVEVFNTLFDKQLKRKQMFTSLAADSIGGLFQYADSKEIWRSVEYYFQADTNNLKRIEIKLYFNANDKQNEFLQDFTIDKFYNTNSVSIHGGNLKVGSQPIFMLINKSDTTFWGASMTNHFYGAIKVKTDSGWHAFSGSYCLSTVLEKPMTKSDTVYSWIPSYNPGEEFKIKRNGSYRYVVSLGLEKYSNSTPTSLIQNGKPRKRTRIFDEIETEFRIE